MAKRGRPKKPASEYPMVAFPGTAPEVYGDGALSTDRQADAVKLLECALSRAKAGFRISPALVEALKKDVRDYAAQHYPGALYNTVNREARKGGGLGAAFEAVAKRLKMEPGTVKRGYPRGGTGIFALRQTFERPTSDTPNFGASVASGWLHTRS